MVEGVGAFTYKGIELVAKLTDQAMHSSNTADAQ